MLVIQHLQRSNLLHLQRTDPSNDVILVTEFLFQHRGSLRQLAIAAGIRENVLLTYCYFKVEIEDEMPSQAL